MHLVTQFWEKSMVSDKQSDIVQWSVRIPLAISSVELKAQVSYSDHYLSSVHPSVSVCSSVCGPFCLSVNFFNFSITTGLISIKFGTKHPYGNMNINCKSGRLIFIQSREHLETAKKKKGGGAHFQKSSSQEFNVI